jgi:hypothetical protein
LDNRHLTFLNSFYWCWNQIIIITLCRNNTLCCNNTLPSRTLPNRKITPAPSEFCWLVISGKFTM